MSKISKTQKGFSTVEALLVVLILVVIGGIGYMVYHNSHQAKTVSTVTATPTPTPAATDPYAGWKTYQSKVGGLSLKYPATWDLSGFNSLSSYVSGDQVDGSESTVRLQSNPATTSNDFGMDIDFRSDPGTNTPYNTYPNGTTTVLKNGITLWQEKQNVTFATGPQVVTCPSMSIGTDNTFSMKLSNGQYMSVNASFCWGERLTTTYSYSQQLSSTEWADAVNILKSVSFN